ncbi:ANK domain containing protein [uncultured Caudovirales phage]|uniref:ANK domain containing protein n=1 Tax=uncultured Caudovirales phage TaxID=2100421 RepID=A0A6J5LS56_9CAUD|nr:ANK domain containing protein [uncultured Caudovirales phage]
MQNNIIKEIKKAIKEGADVNIQDDYGWTALMQASKRGYFEIAELLLEAGADRNIKDKWGITALMIAIHRQKKIAKLLLDASDYAKKDYEIMQIDCGKIIELLTPKN